MRRPISSAATNDTRTVTIRQTVRRDTAKRGVSSPTRTLRRDAMRVRHHAEGNGPGRNAGKHGRIHHVNAIEPVGSPPPIALEARGLRSHGKAAARMVGAAGTADLEERRQYDRAQVAAMLAQRIEYLADGRLR